MTTPDTKTIRAHLSDGAYPIGWGHATILTLCDEVERLRAENERFRGFMEDFAAWKFERIDRRAPDPQDDLDPLTDYLAVEAWQDDARATLGQEGGEA